MAFNISDDCYIDETALLIGEVTLDRGCSIWPYAVLRGDLNEIVVGEGSNIQEHVAVHVYEDAPTEIGDNVSVGHGAVIHGAKIGDNCIIGMQSAVLNGAEVGEECIIGAGAVVTTGMKIPPKSIVVGVPGKVVKENQNSIKGMAQENAEEYHRLRDDFISGKYKIYRGR